MSAGWLRRPRCHRLTVALVVVLGCALAQAEIAVTDDSGSRISLKAPARRIVSLAPHTTELLFAAGAGKALVGVSSFSDYPAQAKDIPSVGNSSALDIERIIALRPDLVVGWQSGNPARQLAQLRKLGIPVFESEPRDFDAIATSIERLAILAGTHEQGMQTAKGFRRQLAALTQKYTARPGLRVFYQIWPAPLMTLNDAHLVGQALRICGGQNIFGALRPLAPTISLEAVVTANPEVILISDEQSDGLTRWRRFGSINAVKRNHLFTINGTLINRAGPRVLDGTEKLCALLDRARQR